MDPRPRCERGAVTGLIDTAPLSATRGGIDPVPAGVPARRPVATVEQRRGALVGFVFSRRTRKRCSEAWPRRRHVGWRWRSTTARTSVDALWCRRAAARRGDPRRASSSPARMARRASAARAVAVLRPRRGASSPPGGAALGCWLFALMRAQVRGATGRTARGPNCTRRIAAKDEFPRSPVPRAAAAAERELGWLQMLRNGRSATIARRARARSRRAERPVAGAAHRRSLSRSRAS